MVSSLEQYQASFAVESGYLNWASFGPLSPIVQEESRADLELLGSGRPSSLNLVVERAESAREHIAAVLGVDASGVTLQPSTTHGLMQAAFGVTGGIVLSRDEFPSLPVAVTRAAEALHVVEPQWIEPDALENGWVTPEAIERALTPATAAVAVSLVDYRSGHRADIAAIREVIGDRLLIVDAIQGFGVVEADYATADVVCGNGYKWLRAGRGTGFAWFSERAIDRLTPVFSGVTGTDVTHPMTQVPAVVSEARAFTVSPYDPIAHARQAAAVHEVREVGVAAIEAAVTERVDRILELAASAGVATITPSDPARRAGIVALKPPAAEVAPLAASLANAGVTSTTRAGIVRVSAHAGTDEQTLSLFAEALQAFAASRAW
ncbi:aminotransferase class V-fold PLP-dependent enzyme [uncultured Microbacterium sp.]|mgnify:CR=1 FL=1|uniref:aminotransferase class V-fold PLP-dependent enzyme n=1 Tax=uncultured Microbacterium sp. TaxID=191216 RepID=UPI0025D3D3AA|nr:aminotransferase class V-fold PLP-dependent enzyme [uncultured Microbacterium sp.]